MNKQPIEFTEALANARLIAASPSMYAYLTELANRGDARAAAIVEAVHA